MTNEPPLYLTIVGISFWKKLFVRTDQYPCFCLYRWNPCKFVSQGNQFTLTREKLNYSGSLCTCVHVFAQLNHHGKKCCTQIRRLGFVPLGVITLCCPHMPIIGLLKSTASIVHFVCSLQYTWNIDKSYSKMGKGRGADMSSVKLNLTFNCRASTPVEGS